MTTRFAPSPTGLLHAGHAYAAKVARDLARESGGRFLLRHEDIDHTRCRPEYYRAIEDDLRWLGLDWDGEPLRQSDRLPAYAAALGKLRSLGVLYPCFCTRRQVEEEVARIANAPHGPEGAHYPGTCRHLSEEKRQSLLAAAEKNADNGAATKEPGGVQALSPAWRLNAGKAASLAGPLAFTDDLHGATEVDPLLLGDAVLARKDIGASYHLAVVVDDAHQGVTLVTRGEDLLPSTHLHRLLQKLLGLPAPRYHHHRLVTDAKGRRLAKRHAPLTLRVLREQGKTPEDVFRCFARVAP